MTYKMKNEKLNKWVQEINHPLSAGQNLLV